MKKKEITEEEANILSNKHEDHFYDRKALAIKGAKVQKISIAFANADGGEFIIGIADDSDEPNILKRWQGALQIEDFNPHLQAISEINPSLDFSCTFLECKSKPGLAMLVRVEKSSTVLSTSDKSVYQRKGAQSLKITDQQKIVELNFAKGSSSFEDMVLPQIEIEKVVESNSLRAFLLEFSPKTDPLEYVINENLADSKSFDPRTAAILLFSDNPQALNPKKGAVKIARYETKDEDIERDALSATYTIEGPLYDLINNTVSKITEIMSNVIIWTAEGLKSANYPAEAIWEIVVNAIIHRDYSISDDVHIYIFNDRIEVLSPGRLPGYVNVDNILDARFSRNPKIVRSLNRYKDAPNKDLGEGLNTAFAKMKEWKLKSPIVEEDGKYVRVTIPHISIATPSEQILTFLKGNDRITNKQAREITGIKSENAMKTEFYKLRDEGYIERVPGLEGPASAWQLIR
jgi:ATP-dependent DNA helicase RecG